MLDPVQIVVPWRVGEPAPLSACRLLVDEGCPLVLAVDRRKDAALLFLRNFFHISLRMSPAVTLPIGDLPTQSFFCWVAVCSELCLPFCWN